MLPELRSARRSRVLSLSVSGLSNNDFKLCFYVSFDYVDVHIFLFNSGF